jgi:MFS family permease
MFGTLGSVFFVVYMLASPLSGYLGDRMQRRKLIAAGIFLWSLSTVASAFAQNYEQLLVARALTGIGEAGYGIVAPAFLADLFDRDSRSRRLAIFYIALPVGTAAGYALGGWIGQHYGWRWAFAIGGAPGLVLAVLAWFLREPVRGGMDPGGHSFTGKVRGGALKELWQNRAFVINVTATTAMTFAIGGLAHWIPNFLERAHQYTTSRAGLYFGILSCTAGTAGTLIGGFVSDRVLRVTATAHFLVPGLTLMLAAVTLTLTVLVHDSRLFWVFGWLTVFLLFANSGPLNAAIVNTTMPDIRSSAFAVTIFTIHLLGDALSPSLMGFVADHASGSEADRLRLAFMIAPPLIFGAGLLLVVFAKRLPEAIGIVERKLAALGKA